MLIMMGKPGCGKTYICSALTSWMFGKVSDMYYFREAKFFERLRASMDQKGDWNQELAYLCDHEFLIFDDIGSAGQGQTGWRQDVFLEVVNNRYDSKKPTVFSTNYNAQEVYDKLGARTHSRMFANENTVIDMFGYPDLRLSD
jgi:DNA replication protein DnaC